MFSFRKKFCKNQRTMKSHQFKIILSLQLCQRKYNEKNNKKKYKNIKPQENNTTSLAVHFFQKIIFSSRKEKKKRNSQKIAHVSKNEF